jgi:guanosine-3',5'-bis(diphosphate) 3'-pyrophosphohydrolase
MSSEKKEKPKPQLEILTIDLAIEFATKKFSSVNLDNHFLRVLAVLQNEFHIEDLELLIAAILHDTLEDTDTTYEELKKTFSKNVADLVQEVSHLKNYNHEQKIEFYKKLKTISPKAKTIKLADFADNLRSIILQRKADPQSPYHNQYILWIRDFLNSCPESDAKELVSKLTKELEVYVTE